MADRSVKKIYFFIYVSSPGSSLSATTRAYHANRKLQNLRRPGRDEELLQVREVEWHHAIGGEPAGAGDGAAFQDAVDRPEPEAVPTDPRRAAGVRRGEGDAAHLRKASFRAAGDEKGDQRDDPHLDDLFDRAARAAAVHQEVPP